MPRNPPSPIEAAFAANLAIIEIEPESYRRDCCSSLLHQWRLLMSARRIHLAAPVVALLAGAAPAMAQSVQVITPGPIPTQSQVIIAPTAPPPPRVETIPPPPSEEARVMYWRPGQWTWDGANWAWTNGHYVSRPTPQAVWEPGHWVERPVGGYLWVDGRWQG